MASQVGTLDCDGTHTQLVWADCTLFIGHLHVDFGWGNADGAVSNLPFGDAVGYPSLSNRTVAISDCQNLKHRNPIFNPSLRLGHSCFSVMTLHVNVVNYCSSSNRLALNARLAAASDEGDSPVNADLAVIADCVPIDRSYMMHCQDTIPIHFANLYLPLIGLPVLPDAATRHDIFELFGTPDEQGGGTHATFGDIPNWVRYSLPDWFLRFQIDSDKITHVTVTLKDDASVPRSWLTK